MLKKITIKSKFNAPIDQVFDLLSKHATLNEAFAPATVKRIVDAPDPQRPDGVGSIRSVGFGPITAVKEQITLLQVDQKIEYQIIQNPLVKYHLGQINFEKISERQTAVVYHIALETKIPGLGALILAQLKIAITIGFLKLNKRHFG